MIAQLYLSKNAFAIYYLNKAKEEAKAGNTGHGNGKVQQESISDMDQNDYKVNNSDRTD